MDNLAGWVGTRDLYKETTASKPLKLMLFAWRGSRLDRPSTWILSSSQATPFTRVCRPDKVVTTPSVRLPAYTILVLKATDATMPQGYQYHLKYQGPIRYRLHRLDGAAGGRAWKPVQPSRYQDLEERALHQPLAPRLLSPTVKWHENRRLWNPGQVFIKLAIIIIM